MHGDLLHPQRRPLMQHHQLKKKNPSNWHYAPFLCPVSEALCYPTTSSFPGAPGPDTQIHMQTGNEATRMYPTRYGSMALKH